MGATATYQLDTERDKDAQAIFERSQKIQEVRFESCNAQKHTSLESFIFNPLQLHVEKYETKQNRQTLIELYQMETLPWSKFSVSKGADG